jgi:T-complex protein 1 subunit theta
MENIQRSIETGVSAFKQILFESKFVNGAAAIESFLSGKISDLSMTLPGLEQYGCKAFADSLEIFGKILLDNAGLKA